MHSAISGKISLRVHLFFLPSFSCRLLFFFPPSSFFILPSFPIILSFPFLSFSAPLPCSSSLLLPFLLCPLPCSSSLPPPSSLVSHGFWCDRYCTEIFDYLSLSAIIDDKVFCVHGGLSPAINTLDQVSESYRVT